MSQGNGDRVAGAYVVVALMANGLRALMTKPENANAEPGVYKDAADAELCAAYWRNEHLGARVQVLACGEL